MLPDSLDGAYGDLACASRYDCGSSSPRPFQSLREVTETSKGYVADHPRLLFVHPATWNVSRILSVEILARRVSRLDALSENVPSTKLQCYLDRAFRIPARLAIAQSVSGCSSPNTLDIASPTFENNTSASSVRPCFPYVTARQALAASVP